jgi:hypothetical protein
MKSRLGVFNTNLVNRSGFAISIEGLVSHLLSTWEQGLPMFMSHDMHRPIGWSSTVGLLIAPELAAVVGAAHLAETQEDLEQVIAMGKGHLSKKFLNVAPEQEQQLRQAIGNALHEGTKIARMSTVCAIEKGIAARLHPELFSTRQDKDSLTDLSRLKQVGPGVFEVDGLLLFAHRSFRRSMSHLNNLNDAFLELFGSFAQRKNLSVKLALDPDIVGLPGTWRPAIELQYWWGPKFNENLPEVQNAVTRHKANDNLRLFHGIDRMEFWWHAQSGIKTLEAEEILQQPSFGISADAYGCRYVHSMIDRVSGKPYHLDGAVRIYDAEKMIIRLDQSIADAGRNSDYVKLWRIDGAIEVSEWKALISHFYRDNRLVGEYFDGVDTVLLDDDDNGAPHAAPEPWSFAAYIPRALELDDGALMLLALGPAQPKDPASPVVTEARQILRVSGGTAPCIELSALDYLKLLKVKHSALALPEDVNFIGIEDTDINLPRIAHRGANGVSRARESMDVFCVFLSALEVRSPNRFLTAEFLISYGNCEISLSLAGFVHALRQLATSLDPLPVELGQLGAWCDKAHSTSQLLFPSSRYSERMLDLVLPSGSLMFCRKEAPTVPDDQNGIPVVSLKVDEALAAALERREIFAVPQFKVSRADCSTCGRDYFTCSCTALLSDGGGLTARGFEYCGHVWTVRPA